MQEKQFVMFDKELLKLREVSSTVRKDKNGVLVKIELNSSSKVLYQYMLDRYLFFKGNGKFFFDNQDTLAEAVGLSVRSIVDIIKKFVSVGLVSKTVKPQVGAIHSNAYIVHDIFDKALFVTSSQQVGSIVSEKTCKNIQTHAIMQDEELDLCPF